MSILTKTYPNGYIRIMTVVSVMADAAENTVLVTTEEDGVVAVAEEDMPDVYAQIIELGLL